MEKVEGVIGFNIPNSIASLFGFIKPECTTSKNIASKNVDTMSFITINVNCNFIPDSNDNSKDFDILYTFNLN